MINQSKLFKNHLPSNFHNNFSRQRCQWTIDNVYVSKHRQTYPPSSWQAKALPVKHLLHIFYSPVTLSSSLAKVMRQTRVEASSRKHLAFLARRERQTIMNSSAYLADIYKWHIVGINDHIGMPNTKLFQLCIKLRQALGKPVNFISTFVHKVKWFIMSLSACCLVAWFGYAS